MSDHIDSIRAQLWEKMRNKKYRETFVAAHLSTNIAAQCKTLREVEDWSQKDLAKRTGMAPARISVIENPSYDKLTLSTLKRLAKAFDVALVVRFVAFSELVKWVSDLSPEKMAVPSFHRDSLAGAIIQSGQKSFEIAIQENQEGRLPPVSVRQEQFASRRTLQQEKPPSALTWLGPTGSLQGLGSEARV